MNQRIDELRTRLRQEPGSRLFFQLGDLLRKAGELDEAEAVLIAGLDHHPRYVAPWVTLGRTQLDKAQFSDAERSFARALELDPENSVAARLIGETAERVGEWVRAIKAYKLARALSPIDQELEERIEAITRRLSGGPDDISVAPPRASFADMSVDGDDSETSSLQVKPPEPFSADEEAPEPEEPFVVPLAPSRPRVIISMSEDDPFAPPSKGDTGVWMVADDVFAPPQVPPSQASADDVFGEESPEDEEPTIVSGEEFESAEELEVEEPFVEESLIEPLTDDDSDLEPAATEPVSVEPDDGLDTEAGLSPDPVYGQEISMPTVTLARLAFDQGDRPLAMETLRAILEKDPEHPEAKAFEAQLLLEENAEVGVELPSTPSLNPAEFLPTKAEALKGWMDNIRAAADRRAP